MKQKIINNLSKYELLPSLVFMMLLFIVIGGWAIFIIEVLNGKRF